MTFLLFTFADSVFSLEMPLNGKECNDKRNSQRVVVITFSCSRGEGVVRIDITVISGFDTNESMASFAIVLTHKPRLRAS